MVVRKREALQLRQLELPACHVIAAAQTAVDLDDIVAEVAQLFDIIVDALALGVDAVGLQMGDDVRRAGGMMLVRVL